MAKAQSHHFRPGLIRLRRRHPNFRLRPSPYPAACSRDHSVHSKVPPSPPETTKTLHTRVFEIANEKIRMGPRLREDDSESSILSACSLTRRSRTRRNASLVLLARAASRRPSILPPPLHLARLLHPSFELCLVNLAIFIHMHIAHFLALRIAWR